MIIIGCVDSRVGNRIRSICLSVSTHRHGEGIIISIAVRFLKVLVFAGGTSGYGGLVYG